MKKIIFCLTCLVIMAITVKAQDGDTKEHPKGFDKSRLFAGGNFGLNFGNYTVINISPQVGYHFSDYFAAGVGINYIYYNYKTYYSTGELYSKSIYSYAGVNVFGRVYPIPQAFIQVQPEINYVWGKERYYDPNQDIKLPAQIVPSLLLGVGAALPAGNGSINIGIFYDVLQNRLSPYYRQPVYTFGYNFGL